MYRPGCPRTYSGAIVTDETAAAATHLSTSRWSLGVALRATKPFQCNVGGDVTAASFVGSRRGLHLRVCPAFVSAEERAPHTDAAGR
jgi:hypothetical protein